jgi:hypothetical protein
MLRRWLCCSAGLLLGVAISLVGAAQETSISIPQDSKFALQLDLKAIKQTKLGAMLFDFAKKKAIEEIGNKSGGGELGIEKIKEVLGFDPFEDLQAIILSSTDFEHPERSMLMLIRLKKSSGNLEGLALSLPKYEASDYKSYQIHSMSADHDMRVYGAIHGKNQSDRTLVLCPNQDLVKSVLDGLDGATASGELRKLNLATSNSPMARLEIYDIPRDKLGQGPQANVAKIVNSFLVDIRDAGENLTFAAKMTTDTDKQAEQLQQMAKGLLAMIDLAQSMDENNEDLKKVKDILVGVDAKCEGKQVQVAISVNSDKVVQAIQAEID